MTEYPYYVLKQDGVNLYWGEELEWVGKPSWALRFDTEVNAGEHITFLNSEEVLEVIEVSDPGEVRAPEGEDPFGVDDRIHGRVRAHRRTYAFPNGGMKLWESGLTKRELFAGMAMQGMLANTTLEAAATKDGEPFELMSQWSVAQADHLLAELAKEQA